MTKFIGQIDPQMDVLTSDGRMIGKVDHEDGHDRVKLAKDKDGLHRWINWDMVERVEGGRLRLNLTNQALQKSWQENPESHIRGPE